LAFCMGSHGLCKTCLTPPMARVYWAFSLAAVCSRFPRSISSIVTTALPDFCASLVCGAEYHSCE
jgi:hypothetical protein